MGLIDRYIKSHANTFEEAISLHEAWFGKSEEVVSPEVTEAFRRARGLELDQVADEQFNRPLSARRIGVMTVDKDNSAGPQHGGVLRDILTRTIEFEAGVLGDAGTSSSFYNEDGNPLLSGKYRPVTLVGQRESSE